MKDNINLIAFGTFGNPNGYTQTFFKGNTNLFKSIRTFDINTSALNLFPGSKVYAIRKEFVNGKNIIAYSVYTYARERSSTRGGTFIGSSILFVDKIAEEEITINCLNDFHNHLKTKNVENDILRVTHSNDFLVGTPRDFNKLNFHLREIEVDDFIQSTNKQLVVYCETNPVKLQAILKISVDMLNVYDTIYFTENAEVAEFVYQKNIFKLLKKEAFEEEVQAFKEEIKKKVLAAVSSFEQEMELLDTDKVKTLKNLSDQIEQNINLHKENENKINESKSNLEKVELIYKNFSLCIKGLVNELRSGKKLVEVKRIYNENKSHFVNSLHKLKEPVLIDQIFKSSGKSGLLEEYQRKENEDTNQRNGDWKQKREYKINRFKVAAAILLILLIGSWAFFVFYFKERI